ncbi:segregation/condensation protein A [Candidatus Fermentibacteria bacterium]|nr:segregation/condensation protein A [Candidatus Fermentibacteria bacterium]
MSADACRISLDAFEGPLDLLLYLIKRDELDIYQIEAAVVAEQYLEYIRKALELDLDVASEYLVMAATLTSMKSRALLPASRGQEADEIGEAEALMRQLVLYKAFKEIAQDLRESEDLWRNIFPSAGERERWSADSPPAIPGQLTIIDLLTALEELSAPADKAPDQRISRPVLTIAECVEELGGKLQTGVWTTLSALTGIGFGRSRIVGFFIAILELVRLGRLVLRQRRPFAEIEVLRTEFW